ncbi:MAG: DegT/DnrJ/EryC1/StrS family aminotransferase [Candidatus Bathyarchaeota archaeon]|nr:DegT/DnrJ/EryC1/StrS family aminotransferase [Candidatus Bathyarchaeota archaeon]
MVEELAINGGPKAVPEGLIKPWPWITEEDKKVVLDVLSRDLSHDDSYPIPELQEDWAKYLGVRHCLVTNSGTSALHMAVAAAGVGSGDEVIAPAYTFLASASCVLHHNGIPVFVDVDPDTYNIDPDKIEEKISKKTKAIVAVHIHGLPADMDGVNAIAKQYGLVVIEDACQAHGAEYKRRKVGSIGDMAAFSLNRSKNLQALEGGLFATDSDEYLERAEMIRQFGEIILPGKAREYNAYEMGWMYRTNEITAALARSQLRRLDELNAVRIRNCEYLSSHLAKIEGVEPPFVPGDRKHVYWFYPIKFKPADLDVEVHPRKFRMAMEKALSAEGIPIGQWQRMPVPAQTLFKLKEGYGRGCPWSCQYARKGIEYKAEDYPQTLSMLDETTFVRGFTPPNGLELMDCFVQAFEKVIGNLESVIEIARSLD